MKSFIVLALFVAAAVAAPAGPDADAQIPAYDSDNIGVTYGYNHGYQTSNDISAQEQGELKNVGSEVRGSYFYIGPDGGVYEVEYIHNKYGFQPQGEHRISQLAVSSI